MKLEEQDKEILKELCTQYDVSFDKVLKLLDTIKVYEFKDRRTGIYDALKEILQSDLKAEK